MRLELGSGVRLSLSVIRIQLSPADASSADERMEEIRGAIDGDETRSDEDEDTASEGDSKAHQNTPSCPSSAQTISARLQKEDFL